MNKKKSVQTLLLLGTVLSIGILGFTSNTNHVFAGSNGFDKNDDHISWNKFKDSSTYKDANKDTQKCVESAHDKGDGLAGYEVKKCQEDSGYGKNGNDDKNNNYGDKNKDDSDKKKDYGDKNKDDGDSSKDSSDSSKDSSDSGDSGDSSKSSDSGDSRDSSKSSDSGDSSKSSDSGGGNSN